MKRKPRFINNLEKRRLIRLGVLPRKKGKPQGQIIGEIVIPPSVFPRDQDEAIEEVK